MKLRNSLAKVSKQYKVFTERQVYEKKKQKQ